MQNLTLSDFDYTLPERLIAQKPVSPRDHARLLVYNRTDKTMCDDFFYNVHHYLPAHTTLVVNTSKVEKARLRFGSTEIFILRQITPTLAEALVRPGRKFRPGKTTRLTDRFEVVTEETTDDGIRLLRFNIPADDTYLDPYRFTPFPPYIRQDESLADEYQTVYAQDAGSKAAPTAGLHFTDSLLQKILQHGIIRADVTLHVGLGTFAPVKTHHIKDHTMHSEWYSINANTAKSLNEAHHVTAVGTTSVRVLESAMNEIGIYHASSGETNIFITPGYAFKRTNALITNFHLPKSTLLMLVSALTGVDELHRIYAHAIAKEYRFFSFGDAMLIV